MNKQNINILIVDDEPNVLKSLSRLLRQYSLSVANNSEEALSLAKLHSFDLVISDYRMPGINGVDFLILFKLIQPDAVRVVLTGHADMEGVQHAINEAQVFRFINKPWNNDELLAIVEKGLEQKRILLENREIVDKVRSQQGLVDEKTAILHALETEEPGITKVNWGEDGSIILNADDL
ncbi:response regulator [Methylomonas sp. AM2-LC]|uniref:response regulator n=1 Tax=Methylomonas sp. AM2-LC TaxID=3153301 RepID=UPI0032664D7A